MQQFVDRIKAHAEHVLNVGAHCNTEETTKQALILPLLDALGFSPFDPTKCKAEVKADFAGAKVGERVDYALYCNGNPVIYIEAKSYSEKLSNHSPQLSRYFNSTPSVAFGAVTNGKEWRFFTDLKQKNIMDDKPFLSLNFEQLDETLISKLFKFRHDEFQADVLRNVAEESMLQNAFRTVINEILKAPDSDFVKFVAGKAGIDRQLNARFVEGITPIVKQAIEKALSGMLVVGLATEEPKQESAALSDDAVIVNPDNENIQTTKDELRALEIAQEILGVDAVNGIDTESYFSVVAQNKRNRWVVRYFGDKKRPTVSFGIDLTDSHKSLVEDSGLEIASGDQVVIDKPDNLMRLAKIIKDSFAYNSNDENFKRQSKDVTPES